MLGYNYFILKGIIFYDLKTKNIFYFFGLNKMITQNFGNLNHYHCHCKSRIFAIYMHTHMCICAFYINIYNFRICRSIEVCFRNVLSLEFIFFLFYEIFIVFFSDKNFLLVKCFKKYFNFHQHDHYYNLNLKS